MARISFEVPANGLVDSRTLARHLGVHFTTVLQWVKEGRIPCLKMSSKTFRFDVQKVKAALLKYETAA